MDVPETDSEDEIPPGWEERCTADGLVFYASHESASTQWTHPRTGKKKRVTGELPYGWERQINEEGKVFFVDHAHAKTTYTDPRLAFAVEESEGEKDLRQRFDGSTTAMQITHGRDLTGKVAVITGANSGIGFETARSLSFRGCSVILACRNLDKAEEAVGRLKKQKPYCHCTARKLDLASLASVKEFSQNFKEEFRRCDILILNAGVFGLPFTTTDDAFETTFQVNFLSQFYLALLIQPLMTSSSLARVVFVAAESHRFASLDKSQNLSEVLSATESNYLPTFAYNNSKLCTLLGCFELHRRFADSGLRCFAVHPGNLVRTNLTRHWWVYKALFALVQPFAKSLEQACACSVYCAVSPDINNCGGMYVNNCTPCLPSPQALDPIIANRLWVFSLNSIEQIMGKGAFFLKD